MIVIVDASVWIATVIATDTFHEDSQRWLRRWFSSSHEIATPALLLSEVAGAISRRTGSVNLAVKSLLDIEDELLMHIIPVDEKIARDGAELAARLALKGADAIYVATARQLSVPLVTWDREQLERAGQIIDVMTPATAKERLA